MSVPRAKKKKTQKERYMPERWQQSRIVEANKLCVALAVTEAYLYYGYREKRVNRLQETYWNNMTDLKEYKNRLKFNGDMTIRYAVAEAERWLDMDLYRALRFLRRDEYRENAYLLCISVMVKTCKQLKWSRKRINSFVLFVITVLRENNVHDCFENVYNEIGFDVRQRIAWE